MKIKTWFLINEVMLCGGTTKKFRESDIPDQSGKVACLNFMESNSMDFWKVIYENVEKKSIHFIYISNISINISSQTF